LGVAIAAAALAAPAWGQSFHLVGIAPGAGGSRVTGLSADGRTAAGWSGGTTVQRSFIWTPQTGRVDVDPQGPGFLSTNNAISGDASTIVGGDGVAYRWSGPGTFQPLGVQPGYDLSFAFDMNHDDSVVVGKSQLGGSGFFGQAFRWTAGGGLQPILTRPMPRASHDDTRGSLACCWAARSGAKGARAAIASGAGGR
jgi:uncharacterized membrane protein